MTCIPNTLDLRIPPREGNNINRQIPKFLRVNNFGFKSTNMRNNNHQISNMRANWILTEVLKRNPKSQFKTKLPADLRLRALESALFMIGYD
jgi:hypothetical protein